MNAIRIIDASSANKTNFIIFVVLYTNFESYDWFDFEKKISLFTWIPFEIQQPCDVPSDNCNCFECKCISSNDLYAQIKSLKYIWFN